MNLQERVAEVIAHGVYRQCTSCRAGAPIGGGFPTDWSLTISYGRFKADGQVQPLTFTPHMAGCGAVADGSP